MVLETDGPRIAACYACATVCERYAISCLEAGQSQQMSRCISVAMDCAQMCRTATALMSRHSDFVDTVRAACAEVCGACAAECNRHNVRHCRQCAEACLRCAALCRETAQQMQNRAACA